MDMWRIMLRCLGLLLLARLKLPSLIFNQSLAGCMDTHCQSSVAVAGEVTSREEADAATSSFSLQILSGRERSFGVCFKKEHRSCIPSLFPSLPFSCCLSSQCGLCQTCPSAPERFLLLEYFYYFYKAVNRVWQIPECLMYKILLWFYYHLINTNVLCPFLPTPCPFCRPASLAFNSPYPLRQFRCMNPKVAVFVIV